MAMLRGLLASLFCHVVLFEFYVEGCCPDGWVSFGQNCYVFIGTPETWMEASQVCNLRGSTLAAITTPEEKTFVEGYVKLIHDMGGRMSFWIGGNDMVAEGMWEWSPSGKHVVYTDWYPGEPDGNGDCMTLYADYGYKWADHGCHVQLGFICERPMSGESIVG